MSTHALVRFYDGRQQQPVAVIYRHWDGRPAVVGAELLRFFGALEELADTRFGSASYLAARYVVYVARPESENPLNFLGLGVVPDDDGCDAEFVYDVRCAGNSRPSVTALAVRRWTPVFEAERVDMPADGDGERQAA